MNTSLYVSLSGISIMIIAVVFCYPAAAATITTKSTFEYILVQNSFPFSLPPFFERTIWSLGGTASARLPMFIELPFSAKGFYPAPNATDVPLNTTIAISFGRTPSICELNLTPNVPISERTYEEGDFGGGTYVFHLAEPLQPQTTYTVVITFGQETAPAYAEDIELISTRTWSFTTMPQAQSTSGNLLLLLLTCSIIAALLIAAAVVVGRRKHNYLPVSFPFSRLHLTVEALSLI